MKIKQGDLVAVIAGKEKGKQGKVLRTASSRNGVIVENVAVVTRHVKKTAQAAGSIVKKEGVVDVSNVMLVCPSCSKATRVGYAVPEEGKKYRVCKKCGKAIDQKVTKKK